jgi:hypothetical protein
MIWTHRRCLLFLPPLLVSFSIIFFFKGARGVISESRSIDRFTRSLRAGRRAREIPWADYLRQQRGGKGLTCSSRRERPWLVGRDRKAATREGQLRVQACLRHVARVSVRDTATRDPRPALQQMVCFRSAWHGMAWR